jgi:hypothetical protein
MSEETIKKIYISLDAILDTRLGTLINLSPDFAFDVSSQEEYYKREVDIFKTAQQGQLTKENFEALFEANRQDLVKCSIMTNIYIFLAELCTVFYNQVLSTPFMSSIEIDVNIHPYKLTDDEADKFLSILSSYIGDRVSINMIDKSDKELTIESVRNVYKAMIFYKYHDWLNLHTNELKKKPLRDLSLYVPKLYFSNVPTKEQLAEVTKQGNDPFTLSQEILAPLVLIQYLPIAFFSANTPFNKQEYLKL